MGAEHDGHGGGGEFGIVPVDCIHSLGEPRETHGRDCVEGLDSEGLAGVSSRGDGGGGNSSLALLGLPSLCEGEGLLEEGDLVNLGGSNGGHAGTSKGSWREGRDK